MIKKQFKFDIKQKVLIEEINVKGRVIALYVTQEGVEYKVRYFDNAEGKTHYFFEDELKKI